MKALIFNSGVGKRLGEHTCHKPKALVELYNGESIFARQIRILHEMGINDFVVTTGPFAEMLKEEAEPFIEDGCSFDFVHNPEFETTNAIYSMYLATKSISCHDFIVLHGDLVFNRQFAYDFLCNPKPNLVATASIQQLNKDFKARVDGRFVREISVDLDPATFNALQPFYKMDSSTMRAWIEAVERCVYGGMREVYAEEALNAILEEIKLEFFNYGPYYLSEIDDAADLERVSREIAMFDWEDQPIFFMANEVDIKKFSGLAKGFDRYDRLSCIISHYGFLKPLVIMGSHVKGALVDDILGCIPKPVLFHDFKPNPSTVDVDQAVDAFEREGCDALISIGGGSAIDVAKAAKNRISKGREAAYNGDNVFPLHIAVPTTAGTGSESTHFAVIYEGNAKTSISSPKLLPDCALLCPNLLDSLPLFQKKCTLLDALCHAIESIWSKQSTPMSRSFAARAIGIIMESHNGYLEGQTSAKRRMLVASNLAGKAINLTTTTAAHALSYKLTSLYGLPHGLAVACCLPPIWKLTLERSSQLKPNEALDLQNNLHAINKSISAKERPRDDEGLFTFVNLLKELFSNYAEYHPNSEELKTLVDGANPERLRNHPIDIDKKDIEAVYLSCRIFDYQSR